MKYKTVFPFVKISGWFQRCFKWGVMVFNLLKLKITALSVGSICLITLLVLISGCQEKTEIPNWSLEATYYESCSCNAPCPCPFGLPMTNSYCKLNGLLEIHEGHYNDIDLKGLQMIMSGSVGKWGEYYFSEATDSAQKHSIEYILEVVNAAGFDTILSSEKTKINFKNNNGKVAFSTSNINVVMSMVKGENDQPIFIQNLKGKLFENYTPYLSQINVRSFSDSTSNFSFEEKAGFISKWNLTDKDFN
jgi:hypothetical protein